MPIIWGALAVLGIGATGYALKEASSAADSTAKLMKWTAAAGAVYLTFQATKRAGVIR